MNNLVSFVARIIARVSQPEPPYVHNNNIYRAIIVGDDNYVIHQFKEIPIQRVNKQSEQTDYKPSTVITHWHIGAEG